MPSTATDRLQGLTTSVAVKAPCRVATTGNISLSGLQTIDGVALSLWDRVLVKDQVSLRDNGIYLANSGAWSRALDFDGTRDAVGGTFLKVNSGSLNADSYWSVEGDGPINIGTDDVVISPSSGNITLQAALASSTGSSLVGFQQAGTGAVTRTVQGKLRDVPDLADWVVGGDSDDAYTLWPDITTSLQAYIDYCVSEDLPIHCSKPIYGRVASTITITPNQFTSPAGGALAHPIDLRNLTLVPSGSRNRIILDIGTAPGGTLYDMGEIRLPRIIASGALQWPATLTTADTAVRIRNVWRTTIYESYIYGFTKGIELSGCPYNSVFGKLIYDCRYGRVWTTAGASHDLSFSNENRVYGGSVSGTSASSALGSRYGDVLTWDKVSSYRGHNDNRFHDVCYELGGGGAADAVPVWFDGVGAHNRWEKCRSEGNNGSTVICDGGAARLAFDNRFEFTYVQYSGQNLYVQQVNGACGNRLTGPGCNEISWHSGSMANVAMGSGNGSAAYLKGRELFLLCASTPTVADISRVEPSAGYLFAHRRGAGLTLGGNARLGVAIDTSITKDFLCSYEAQNGFPGRPFFMALDGSGALLTGNAADVTWGNEPYVKGSPLIEPNALSVIDNGYSIDADLDSGRALHVTVRDEVKTLLFLVSSGTAAAVVRSMSVTAYTVPNEIGSAYPTIDGINGLRVFSMVDDDGSLALSSANPATSGKHGHYQKGQFVGSTAAASLATPGWTCTASGWLAPAWAISTAYAVPGMLATNDTGKIYELVTAGTSAGSGGPTGTGAAISDGTCTWKYIGVLATFAAMANLA